MKTLKASIKNQYPYAITVFNKSRALLQLVASEIRTNYLGQLLPMKPDTLNLLVNDVCNSRCQMCLIWQNKKDKEISADELATILSDDLFSDLQYIGVSGGEPTLRSDLPELFEAICSKQPRIRSTGIITNGIIEEVVKQRILACAEVCRTHGVDFNVMVSLDGLDEVHDTIRGRKNNFNSAISLLDFFHKDTDIPTSFGCTITTSNALYVDELLDYAKAEGLYGRFRIAEFIDRLYNDKQSEFIRAFDEKLLYHLGLFFFRVEHDFEQQPIYRKTYRNIRRMLVEAQPRQIGCPYQTRAAVLTSRGELLYCSPKSPNLGNTLQSSAKAIYFSNIAKRKQIIEQDCQKCIHDYHVPVTLKEKFFAYWENRRIHNNYNCTELVQKSSQISKAKQTIKNLSSLNSRKVLIVGWYGTETAGDKAILWSIIDRLRSRPNPPDKIYISSLYPFISHWTVKEMQLGNVSIVETYSKDFERACDEANEIVVGGGPLMDIEPLNHILYAFMRTAKSKAVARIEGCGIGPLFSPLYTQVVSEILRLSDHIILRDRTSTDRCCRDFGISDVDTVPDPATNYVLHIQARTELLRAVPPLGETKNVSCFLREWSREYAARMDESEYDLLKQGFEAQLAKLVAFAARIKDADIHLLPMHTFHIGGDDRVFNRRLANSITPMLIETQSKSTLSVAREPISPLEILQSMAHAEFNICMRFHSVLFAETLGVPYVAIDYTGGGKIKAFLESKGQMKRLISLQDVATGQWQNKLESLLIDQCKIEIPTS
jgi:MoaA/NifB/PqqE/SkfB family radical SAM enzyme/polysaccharide pyruvyl transferase WcaK-like protein